MQNFICSISKHDQHEEADDQLQCTKSACMSHATAAEAAAMPVKTVLPVHQTHETYHRPLCHAGTQPEVQSNAQALYAHHALPASHETLMSAVQPDSNSAVCMYTA